MSLAALFSGTILHFILDLICPYVSPSYASAYTTKYKLHNPTSQPPYISPSRYNKVNLLVTLNFSMDANENWFLSSNTNFKKFFLNPQRRTEMLIAFLW